MSEFSQEISLDLKSNADECQVETFISKEVKNLHLDDQEVDKEKSSMISSCKEKLIEHEASKDIDELYQVLTHLNSMITENNKKKFPIQDFINCGIHRDSIRLLSWSDFPKIQLGAACILTNICTKNYFSNLLKNGEVVVKEERPDHPNIGQPIDFITPMVNILKTQKENIELINQIIMCLKNLSTYDLLNSTYIISCGALEGLLDNFSQYIENVQSNPNQVDHSFINNFSSTLGILCKNEFKNVFYNLKNFNRATSVMKNLIELNIEECNISALWALKYLTEYNEDLIVKELGKKFLDNKFCTKITQIISECTNKILSNNSQADSVRTNLMSTSMLILIPSIKLVGNFAIISDEIIPKLTKNGLLESYGKILSNHTLFNNEMIREICWTLSNIAASNQLVQKDLLKNDLLSILKQIILQPINRKIFEECVWTFCNLISEGSSKTLVFVLELKVFNDIILGFTKFRFQSHENSFFYETLIKIFSDRKWERMNLKFDAFKNKYLEGLDDSISKIDTSSDFALEELIGKLNMYLETGSLDGEFYEDENEDN